MVKACSAELQELQIGADRKVTVITALLARLLLFALTVNRILLLRALLVVPPTRSPITFLALMPMLRPVGIQVQVLLAEKVLPFFLVGLLEALKMELLLLPLKGP